MLTHDKLFILLPIFNKAYNWLTTDMMMERLIKHVLDTLANLGHTEQVALYTIQENSYLGIVAGGFIRGEFVLPGRHVELKNTPMLDIIVTKKANTYPGILLEDSLPFPSYEDKGTGFECFCLPLMNETDNVVGVAVLSQEIGISPPDYRMQTLSMLRTLIAAAMENARLFQLATIDSLTGLYVRRYFELRLHEEFTRIHRHGGVLSLLMVDIDYFKQINDTYGHQQGDRVLQEFANLLYASTRHDIDLPCRYGGEEFIIMLPNTDCEGAYVLAERIRSRCEQYTFTTLQGDAFKITVSAGIVSTNQIIDLSKEELIKRADLMLYAAKQAGRNRVMRNH